MRLSQCLFCISLFFALGTAAANAAVSEASLNAALTKLDQNAQEQINEHKIVGMAVGVVYKDKLVFAKGYGPRELSKPAQIDPETVFQLASVSKPVSATVVAELVGEGKISWDTKISSLDPSFQMYDPYVTKELTIRDLYSHRSGLPEHAGDLLEDIGFNREQVLHRMRYQKPESSFRAGYSYTNFGLTEGAIAACKAYGTSWEQASAAKLFQPLSMNSSSSTFSGFDSQANKALSHVRENGTWVHRITRQPDAQSPAGGVSSSVNDLSKWMRLVLNKGKFDGKQIVNEDSLVEIMHPQMLTNFNPLNGLPSFYGLGMNVRYDTEGKLRLGHSGAFALGNATCIDMIPSEQLGVIVLTNSEPVGVAEALSNSFMDNFLYGKDTIDWFALFKKIFSDPSTFGLDRQFDYSVPPKTISRPLDAAAYLGKYGDEFYGTIEITEDSGKLSLLIGPNKTKYPLQHYDRDTFTFLPIGENAQGRSGVTFTIGSNGIAQKLQIELLSKDGHGSFDRLSSK